MKILKGSLKGRNIKLAPKARAVSLRVKKSCFDILRDELPGKSVLDLFAGSGSLGIEALSLGAESALFVDCNRSATEVVKKNLTLFKLMPKAEIYLKDACRQIKNFAVLSRSFDLVFLDPPYYKGLLKKSLQTLEKYDILAPSGLLVCFCFYKDDYLKTIRNFSLILSKKYGQNLLLIYRKNNEKSNLPGDL